MRNADTDTHADTYANTNTDTNSHAYTDAYTDANSYSYSHTDSSSDWVGCCHRLHTRRCGQHPAAFRLFHHTGATYRGHYGGGNGSILYF